MYGVQQLSKQLKQYYIDSHTNTDVYSGSCTHLHAISIKNLIQMTRAQSLLDYGCGKGKQYFVENLHIQYFDGIMPHLYDIGIDKYNNLPEEKIDGVFSTDVLEHIPEEELDDVFSEMYSLANKFVYHGICTIPADTFLPNGENAHVTLHELDWWTDKIKPYAKLKTLVYCYGDKVEYAYLENNQITFKKGR